MSALLKILREGHLLEILDVIEPLMVGRAEGCVVRLEDHAISRKHAVLTPDERPGVIRFEKKSEFGWIRHNGVEKSSGSAVPGDVLEMGPFHLEVSQPAGSSDLSRSEAADSKSPVHQSAPVEVGTPLPMENQLGSPLSSSAALPVDDSSYSQSAPAEGVTENQEGQMDGGVDLASGLDLDLGESAPDLSLSQSEGGSSQDLISEEADREGAHSETGSNLNGLELSQSPSEAPGQSDRTALFSSEGATRLTPIGRVSGRLVFAAGAASVDQYDLAQGPEKISIGRGKSSDVVLQDKKSSRAHLEIHRRDGQFVLVELGSANGTFINGQRLEPNSETALQSGDQVQAGDAQFVFEVVSQDYYEREQSFLPSESSNLPVGLTDHSALDQPNPDYGNFDAPQFGNDLGVASPGVPESNSFESLNGIDSQQNPGGGAKGNGSLLDRYRAIPPKRRKMLLGILALVMVFGYITQQEEEELAKSAKKKPKPRASVSGQPLMMSFDDLSKEQKQRVLQGREEATRHYTGGEFEDAVLKADSVLSILPNDDVASQIKKYGQIAIQKKKQIDEENERKRQAEERLEKIKTMVAEIEAKMETARKIPDAPNKFDAIADELANSEIRVLDPENIQIKKWETEIGEFRQKMMDIQSSRVQLGDLRKDFEDSFRAAKVLVDKTLAESEPRPRLKGLEQALKALADIRLKEGYAADEARKGNSQDKSMGADLKAISKVISEANREAVICRKAIDETVAPLVSEAQRVEDSSDFVKAFDLWRAFVEIEELRVAAYLADGQDVTELSEKNRGRDGMERIRGVLNAQAKSIYTEGVLAESYSDFTKAREKFQELLDKAPKDDASTDGYYERARRKLALYRQFDQANGSSGGTKESAAAKASVESYSPDMGGRDPAQSPESSGSTVPPGDADPANANPPVPTFDPASGNQGTGP